MKLMKFAALAVLAAMTAVVSAQVRINELQRDVPGADNGFEFVELKGTPNLDLSGYWLLIIEGDGSGKGLIDQAVPLTGQSLGSNGLLLIRDAATTLLPAPAGATNTFVIDFNLDIENGTATYFLVQGYTGYVINGNTNAGQNNVVGQTDIDANDDGVAGDWGTVTSVNAGTPITTAGGSQPWTTMVDALGVNDTAPTPPTTDFNYAAQYGGLDFGIVIGRAPGNIVSLGQLFIRISNTVSVFCDIALGGPTGGPYGINPDRAESIGTLNYDWLGAQTATPGSENPQPNAVVYPVSVAIIEGQFLFGTIASLNASDNNRYAIVNDENAPAANVEFTTTSPFATLTQFDFKIETVSVRDDQSQFFAVWDNVANDWFDLDFTISALADQTRTGTVTTNPTRFVNGSSEIRTRLLVIPTQDLDAGDGWSNSIDLHELTLTP